jgi:hypothetical protein
MEFSRQCIGETGLKRLIDCYLQEWRAYVSSNGVLRHLYSYVKEQFSYELYLDKINCKPFRSALTRLRVSSHRLRIESEGMVEAV